MGQVLALGTETNKTLFLIDSRDVQMEQKSHGLWFCFVIDPEIPFSGATEVKLEDRVLLLTISGLSESIDSWLVGFPGKKLSTPFCQNKVL